MRIRFLLLLLLAIAIPALARAHDTNMAVLQIDELQPGRYMTRWIVRSNADALTPVYPAHCRLEAPVLDCGPEGLVGEIAMLGLGPSQSAAVLRVTHRGGSTQVFTLTPGVPSANLAVPLVADSLEGWLRVGGAYTVIGIEHILLGIDHLLFVLGLMWIVRAPWMLAKTITGFTIAHSITLAAASFGWIGVPERAVNAAIALSIVFVGVEMLRVDRGQGGLTARHPWIVAFAFGLLHGFGFADGLARLGLPEAVLPLGLLTFNLGVEIGQFGFVLLVLVLAWAFRTLQVRWPRWSLPVPAYAIGSLAVFWFIGRVDVLFFTAS
ncbi:MAG: HupE/UreJ family protein [Kiloniellaceae bacterium]